MERRRVEISVRALVGLVLQSGDLATGFINPGRGTEGARAHQKVQQMRPPEYETEVPVRHTEVHDDCEVEVSGRVDGLFPIGDTYRIEEIKTTRHDLDREHAQSSQHWAQAQIYGYFVATQKDVTEVEIQLIYVNLNSWELAEERRNYKQGSPSRNLSRSAGEIPA